MQSHSASLVYQSKAYHLVNPFQNLQRQPRLRGGEGEGVTLSKSTALPRHFNEMVPSCA
jgi:hypothetical protein